MAEKDPEHGSESADDQQIDGTGRTHRRNTKDDPSGGRHAAGEAQAADNRDNEPPG